MKKTIIKTLSFILLVTITKITYCQSNYQKGYIIQLNGDTLSGFIDYHNWSINPKKISFTSKLKGEKTVFTPFNIKGFGVADEIYKSAVIAFGPLVDYQESSNDVAKGEIIADTVFLQTIVQGAKNLFYYNGKNGTEAFFINQNSEFKWLIYNKKLVQQYGKTGLYKNKKYREQLALYLQSCKTIQDKLGDTKYNSSSLTDVYNYYYTCSGDKIEFQKKKKIILSEIGVLAGLSSTKIVIHGVENDVYHSYLAHTAFTTSNAIAAGVFWNLLLPNNKRWSIANELLFTSFMVEGTYKNVYYYTDTYYTKIGTQSIKMNNMLRFSLPVGKVACLFNVGLSNGYILHETNYLKLTHDIGSTVFVTEQKILENETKYHLGFVAGLGVKYKKNSIQFRFEDGESASYEQISCITKRMYLLIARSF